MTQVWDAGLYDSKHGFVTEYGESLVNLLNPIAGERILDVGCGTAHLTQKIAEHGAQVLGIDISEQMINRGREIYPDLNLRVDDITLFQEKSAFDAVFSNAVLHWVSDPEAAVHRMASALKRGGRLVVEFGGKGNIQLLFGGLVKALQEIGITETGDDWYYPTIGAFTTILERHGLEPIRAELYDRPTELTGEDGPFNWYCQFRSGIRNRLGAEIFDNAARRAQEIVRSDLFRNETWYADYRRLRVVARKV